MKKRGFTLTELMFAVSIFSMVIAGTTIVYVACNRSWFVADIQMRCMREANMILQKMVYGAYGTNGLRSAIYTNVTISSAGGQWSVTYSTPDGGDYYYAYVPANQTIVYSELSGASNIVTIGTHVLASTLAGVSNKNMNVMVRVGWGEGRFGATNTLSTCIHYRN